MESVSSSSSSSSSLTLISPIRRLFSQSLSPTTIALLHGQWISILIAGTGVFATLLSSTTPSSNFPLLMNFCNYSVLSLFLLRRKYRSYQENQVATEVKSDPEKNQESEESIEVIDFNNSQVQSASSFKGDNTASSKRVVVNKWVYLFAAVMGEFI